MEPKDLSILNLSKEEQKDLIAFCSLNELDVTDIIYRSFKQGYYIEKHGLLGKWDEAVEKVASEKEVIVEKIIEVPVEVIKEIFVEVPVEKIVEKTIEIIKEVPIEKVVVEEIIKEIPIDRVIEKEVYITNDEQVKELGGKIDKLENEKNELLLKIQQLENGMSKKNEELDELRSSLDELLAKPPVEIIKEIPTIVEKITVDDTKLKALQETISKLQTQLRDKNQKISELEEFVQSFNREIQGIRGTFLRSSNLTDDLYK